MVSHTTTGEWKSFEQRMRRRRAERLLLRADIAAEAGFIDDARAALAEAQRIFPTLPDIRTIEERVRAAEVAPPPALVAPRYPRHAYGSIAAALVILATGGVWQASHVHRLPARNIATIVPAASAPEQSSDPAPRVNIVVEHPALVSAIGTSGRGAAQATPTPVEDPAPATERPVPSIPDRTAPSMIEPASPSIQPAAELSLHAAAAPPVLNLGQPVAAAPSPVPPAREAPRPITAASDETLVRRTLRRYAAAYSNLDADAAQAVWPTVNRSALARAFDDLASQQISLGDCRIDLTGARARAACAGSMTWAPRVGGATSRTEPRNWEFELAKAGDDWRILRARVQNR